MSHEQREKSPEEIADDIAQLDFYAHCDRLTAMTLMEAAIVNVACEVNDLEVFQESDVCQLRRNDRTLVLRPDGPRVKGEGMAMEDGNPETSLSCSTITWYVDEPDSLGQLILAWLS